MRTERDESVTHRRGFLIVPESVVTQLNWYLTWGRLDWQGEWPWEGLIFTGNKQTSPIDLQAETIESSSPLLCDHRCHKQQGWLHCAIIRAWVTQGLPTPPPPQPTTHIASLITPTSILNGSETNGREHPFKSRATTKGAQGRRWWNNNCVCLLLPMQSHRQEGFW